MASGIAFKKLSRNVASSVFTVAWVFSFMDPFQSQLFGKICHNLEAQNLEISSSSKI